MASVTRECEIATCSGSMTTFCDWLTFYFVVCTDLSTWCDHVITVQRGDISNMFDVLHLVPPTIY